MITYLKDGWYTRIGTRRLRNEVVDGAIDTASMLFRAAVPAQAITSLALKIRALATIADPPHRRAMGGVAFGPQERAALVQRLQLYTDRFPALQSLINDCLEHVTDVADLRALYLHLIHVTQMMQLLIVAKLSGAAGGLGIFGLGASPPHDQSAHYPSAVQPPEKAAKTRATAQKKAVPGKKATAKKSAAKKKAPAKKKASTKKKTAPQAGKKPSAKKKVSKKTAAKKKSATKKMPVRKAARPRR